MAPAQERTHIADKRMKIFAEEALGVRGNSGAKGHRDVIISFSRVLTLWDHRGLRAEAIHLPLVPRPSLDWRKEVHNLMISKEASKSRKSTSSQ